MPEFRESDKLRRRPQRERLERRERHGSLTDTEKTLACRDLGSQPRGLDRAREELTRLDRIAERDSTRRLVDFSPERARKLEDLEIKTSPEGFLRRHRGEGLDDATRREVCRALEMRGLRSKSK